ncbi:ATP-binding protein [Terrimonas sp. NA20]|uniref:histidine kinase n=1 Tax=Terrimonas ginsenosidimutans TaxID=2908004 RepID=A0ABS9KRX7_9BACT|nr:ATP-binding protein [Terrimonas ginsenosidimutans]MCG2615047.1 ATP-binding protein [Terrimonas ginsenosidimutans]
MANSVKKKIRLGTLFLFLLLLLSGGVCIFHLIRLKNDAKEILKDNYESLDYGHRMQGALDSVSIAPVRFMADFDRVLRLQEENLTEAGERDATVSIRKHFDVLRNGSDSSQTSQQIRAGIQRILSLNMAAIEAKNEKANRTADKALTYISFLAAIIFIIGITFSFNFPEVLTTPINSLTEGIREITNKNYRYRINLERKDEFGQMADAFNNMAERLEYFENSNLNKIIFEKTRAEAVINSLKEASIGFDKHGVILFANDQALQLLGLQAKEVIGKPVEDIAKRNDLLRFLLEEKGSMPFKIVVENRENYFTKEIMEIPQDNSSSKVIVLRNITSFKELDVAKTNFIATISHELKTPLASSDFSLKLLDDERIGKLSADQRELVQHLKDDNQRMLRILSELLNMSQVESGKIQLDITEVRPEMIADNAIAAASTTAREKNIIIQKRYAENAGLIRADAEKTGWVLNNFLINAIKHSYADSTIIVSIQKNGSEIEVSVTDQGVGIPSEYSEKIFERFFKVPGSKTAGTGLGLSISKEFIEAEGGRIWMKSEIGLGSTFGFSLPVSR